MSPLFDSFLEASRAPSGTAHEEYPLQVSLSPRPLSTPSAPIALCIPALALNLLTLLFVAVFKQLSPHVPIFLHLEHASGHLVQLLLRTFQFFVHLIQTLHGLVRLNFLSYFRPFWWAQLLSVVNQTSRLAVHLPMHSRQPRSGLGGHWHLTWLVSPRTSQSRLIRQVTPEKAPFLHLITLMFGRSSTPLSPYAAINRTSVGRSPRLSCPKMLIRAVSNMTTSGSSRAKSRLISRR